MFCGLHWLVQGQWGRLGMKQLWGRQILTEGWIEGWREQSLQRSECRHEVCSKLMVDSWVDLSGSWQRPAVSSCECCDAWESWGFPSRFDGSGIPACENVSLRHWFPLFWRGYTGLWHCVIDFPCFEGGIPGCDTVIDFPCFERSILACDSMSLRHQFPLIWRVYTRLWHCVIDFPCFEGGIPACDNVSLHHRFPLIWRGYTGLWHCHWFPLFWRGYTGLCHCVIDFPCFEGGIPACDNVSLRRFPLFWSGYTGLNTVSLISPVLKECSAFIVKGHGVQEEFFPNFIWNVGKC